ncbi:MAG: hypothetical protein GYA23_04280 [Methanomicrobiales archaeon]|nr:hypothetical protein [Methanomicrobiales archaeon]
MEKPKMKLHKLSIVLLAFLLAGMAMVPCVSALKQATDVEGRGDISYLYDDVSVYAANTQNSMGYSASPYFRPAKSTILSRMTSDYIFHFNGHGEPGKFQISDSSDVWITGTELSSRSFPNMKFALFQCCNCGVTSSSDGNLVASVVGHGSGSTCAFGYAKDLLTINGAIQYSQGFWDAAQGGSSPSSSHYSALSRLQSSRACRYTDDSYCHYTSLVASGICSSSLVTSRAAVPKTESIEVGIPESTISTDIVNDAKSKIGKFTGTEVTGLKYIGSEKSHGTEHYSFTSDTARFVINSATGRIEFAQFNDAPVQRVAVDKDEAYTIAESFVMQKSADVKRTTKTSLKNTFATLNRHSDSDSDYVFVWREILQPADLNAIPIIGPDSVTVIVTSTGQIRLYSEFIDPGTIQIGLEPKLTEEQAWNIASEYYAKQGLNLDAAAKDSKGLMIWDDNANDQGWKSEGKQFLAWVFYARETSDITKGGQIAIDSQDGHIINYAIIT